MNAQLSLMDHECESKTDDFFIKYLDLIDSPILILSHDNEIKAVNCRFTQLFRIHDWIYQKDVLELLNEKFKHLYDSFDKVIETKILINGITRYIKWSVKHLVNSAGFTTLRFLTGCDITDQIMKENELSNRIVLNSIHNKILENISNIQELLITNTASMIQCETIIKDSIDLIKLDIFKIYQFKDEIVERFSVYNKHDIRYSFNAISLMNLLHNKDVKHISHVDIILGSNDNMFVCPINVDSKLWGFSIVQFQETELDLMKLSESYCNMTKLITILIDDLDKHQFLLREIERRRYV